MGRLTNKEKFDQRTMLYFYPNKTGGMPRVRDYDRQKMAALSSKGIQPKNRTPGFLRLLWGKTYRDLQVTEWRDAVRQGYITKSEVYDSVPEWLLDWAVIKLKDVPYDEKGETTNMIIRMYHNG
jgi:hypothetical protein